VLVDHTKAPARHRQRKHGNDRRAGSQRQRGQRGRCRRRPVEEVNVHGIRRLNVLIDEHGDGLVRVERTQHPSNRAAPINHRVARFHPRRLEQLMKERVVERPGEHRHGLELEGVHERIDFPITEVTGVEQDAFAVRVRRHHTLLPFEAHSRQHVLGRHRPELEQHREQPAEVRKHAARDRAAFGLTAQGKRGLDVANRAAPMWAVEPIERPAEERPDRQHDRHRQQPSASNHARDSKVFETMAKGGGCFRRNGHAIDEL
jgi:hypothetical protein